MSLAVQSPSGLYVDGQSTPKQKVVIFGVGDFSRLAAQLMRDESGVEVEAFTLDKEYIEAESVVGMPVVPFESILETHPPSDYAILVGIGYSDLNSNREAVCLRVQDLGYKLVSYVSTSASVSPTATFGWNTFIFEENVVQPFVNIGNNVVLWSGNHIGHDATIEDHCFLASHIVVSGRVRIGHHSFVGVNATFRDNIAIAPKNIVGASAVMLKDTDEGDVYAVRRTEKHPKKSWEIQL